MIGAFVGGAALALLVLVLANIDAGNPLLFGNPGT
jgi:hypothetical protein